MEGINNIETKLSLEGNEWVLPTDLATLEPAEEAFRQRLEDAGWDEDNIYYMGLAFHEALVNAMIHGNLGMIKPDDSIKNIGELAAEELLQNPTKKNKKVLVSVDINDQRIYVRIKDEGKGFKVEKVPDPTKPGGLMKTKGRGLLMMEKVFDSVEYVGKGNEIVLSKDRK